MLCDIGQLVFDESLTIGSIIILKKRFASDTSVLYAEVKAYF
jgi:hypothetical protein